MTASNREVRLLALSGVPLVQAGDDLGDIILHAVAQAGEALAAGDVLVIAQKIVSKAEGRLVDLAQIAPSPRAVALAREVDKDARVIQLILDESLEILRVRRDVVIAVHRNGFVMANAGIDFSNVDSNDADERVLLLPLDPDGTCERIRSQLQVYAQVPLAVIINDSHGRAWRNGTVGVAIGASGLPALLDLRGTPDLFGRELRSTQVGIADEIAAAASMLMGQAGEGTPVVLLRGLQLPDGDGSAADLHRARELDLFR
jgi:coenzyme F420-0:L-glutamate ligase/coenzyme F420-1:gamma-L-glutamate ligase